MKASFACAQDDERCYVPVQNLSISSEGIFLQTDCYTIQLPEISYDYEAQSFYITDSKNLWSRCSSCGKKTWNGWCCLNLNCKFRC